MHKLCESYTIENKKYNYFYSVKGIYKCTNVKTIPHNWYVKKYDTKQTFLTYIDQSPISDTFWRNKNNTFCFNYIKFMLF